MCPICVIVAGTWATLLVARSLGATVDLALISMLMGGSVVGISYTLSKKLPETSWTIWKLTSIPIGFVAVYTALTGAWWVFVGMIVAAIILGLFFFRKKHRAPASAEARKLEEKMKQCC